MKTFKEYITEKKDRSPKPKKLTVYHGTTESNLAGIKKSGLIDKQKIYAPTWYMVSTDFGSALFHANATEENGAVVIEFEVPTTNEKWEGDPWFWPPNVRSKTSSWFAPTKQLPKKFIKKVHMVSFEDFRKNK